MPDARTRVARDAEVDEEFADVEAQSAHDAHVAVVEADLEQLRDAAPLGFRDAEQRAAEQAQHAELEAQLDGDFEPLGAQRDAAAPGVLGQHVVIDEGVVQFRLQVEVFRKVEPQDEAHVVTGPDGAGREAGVADAGRDERVVGEVDAAAYADHQALGGGRAGEDERGEEGEDQVFHKTLMFRTGSHQG